MGNLKHIFKEKLIVIPIIISTLIFFLSFLAGIYLNDVLLPLVGNDLRIDNINIGTMDILKNNMSVIFINIGLGIVTLGIYGIFANAFNAVNLGITMGIAITKFGLKTTLLRIVPHGIFEIPTMIVSTAFGFMAFGIMVSLIKKKEMNIRQVLQKCGLLIVITIIFVIIAAVIEGQISMNLK